MSAMTRGGIFGVGMRAVANAGVATAAAIFGACVVATHIAVQSVPPVTLAVCRFALGAVALWLIALAVSPRLLRVERRDLAAMALLGALLFGVSPFAFNAGLRLTDASKGAVMIATIPLWSAALGRLFGRERLATRHLIGIALTLAGVIGVIAAGHAGVSASRGERTIAGDALLLVSAASAALYGFLAKPVLRRYPALCVTAYAMLFGTLFLSPVALSHAAGGGPMHAGHHAIGLILFLGIVGAGAAYALWTFGLTHLTPTQVAVHMNLVPVVAIALSATVLGEHLGTRVAWAALAVLTGVILVNWPPRTTTSAPPPLAAETLAGSA